MPENGKTILVVEDDADLNEMVGAYVKLAGYGYHKALNGVEAVRSADENRPSLILLDIMLPDVDGLEVCRRLKQKSATADIPVVMLSALDRPAVREQSAALGAVAYITKPFDPEMLLGTIRTHAGNGQARG